MMIREAIAFAEQAHTGQVRKYDGAPYITHPLEVMNILVQHVPRVPDYVLAAALLHDVLEDTKVTRQELFARFGNAVYMLVDELTTPDWITGPRHERKRLEAMRLSHAMPDTQTIKYADIMSNVKDINLKDPEFAKIYIGEKQRQVMLMRDGYAPLRGSAWLALLEATRK